MVAHLSLKLKAVLETESLNFFISDHDRGHINKLLTGHRTAAELASYFSKEDHSAETPVNFFPEGVSGALALRYPHLAENHRGIFKRVALTARGSAYARLGDEIVREQVQAVLLAAKEEHLNDNSHEEKDEDEQDYAVSPAGPSSRAFTAYSDRSRQNAARRGFRKSDEGREKLAKERSEKIAAQKEDLKDLVNKMKADGLNIRNAASKLSISDSLSDRQVKALLLNFLNTVRRGESSCRYPLTFASPAVFHIFQVKYTAPTLLAMARDGKLFEPRAFPDALEREMEEMEEKTSEETSEEPEDDRTVFKFYTRCTPLRKTKQLLEQLDGLERHTPSSIGEDELYDGPNLVPRDHRLLMSC